MNEDLSTVLIIEEAGQRLLPCFSCDLIYSAFPLWKKWSPDGGLFILPAIDQRLAYIGLKTAEIAREEDCAFNTVKEGIEQV